MVFTWFSNETTDPKHAKNTEHKFANPERVKVAKSKILPRICTSPSETNQRSKKKKIAHPNPLHLTPSHWGVHFLFGCGWPLHMCQVELQDIVSGCRGVHVEETYVYKKQCKVCTARVSPSVFVSIKSLYRCPKIFTLNFNAFHLLCLNNMKIFLRQGI